MLKKNWKIGAILVLSVVIAISYILIFKADYHGIVHENSDNSFYIAPLSIDPEVDYIFPKILITKDTEIVGEKELQEGQEVKVWVNKERNQEIAIKINIIE